MAKVFVLEIRIFSGIKQVEQAKSRLSLPISACLHYLNSEKLSATIRIFLLNCRSFFN